MFECTARSMGEKFSTWANGAGANRGGRDKRAREQEPTGRMTQLDEGGGGRLRKKGDEVDWELPPELLDGGQGESYNVITHDAPNDREGGQEKIEDAEGRDVRGDGGASMIRHEGVQWTPPQGEPPSNHPWSGLHPPVLLSTGQGVTGETKGALRRQIARERKALLEEQVRTTQWKSHVGAFMPSITESIERREYKGGMCPQGLALHHPAAQLLGEWSQLGCPAQTGRDWTKLEMAAAIRRGPHASALAPEAIEHFRLEATEKVALGQAKIVLWDDIKDNPPAQLKISPIAAIPHKSKAFRSILDLSFRLRLEDGGVVMAVNDTSTKTAPKGSIDQIGHSLKRIIHAFAEAEEGDKIFMAKWDVKDGFWRLQCREGEEWNFSYVLPQEEGKPIRLVVPTSLQMGWIESPPYFCAASETARDVAEQYIEMKVGTLPAHKFEQHTIAHQRERGGIVQDDKIGGFKYVLEVYVDDFMSLVVPTAACQLQHVANAVMKGIHDVFPADAEEENDPISLKKMKQGEGRYSTRKCILGFDFDGEAKTLWLEEEKRALLLTILHGWLRGARRAHAGIPFKEFESVTAKVRHAFTAIPAGKGLLSPCNGVLRTRPEVVYLHRNNMLAQAIRDARTLLRESTVAPTRCRELVAGWPDFIGVQDASGQGVGGVVFGENRHCPPTVFRYEWPEDIKCNIITRENRSGGITNSDLEMAGLLLTWLVMEEVCGDLQEKRVAVFSDNDPTVSWVKRLASRHSMVAAQLVRALALRMKLRRACPITPVHIPGVENAMTDIPSRSFGSVAEWFCKTDLDLLTLFNARFPLPGQASWTVFRITSRVFMRVISVLRMQDIALEEWRRLPKIGGHIGNIGAPMSNLWGWSLTFRRLATLQGSASLQDSQPESDGDAMGEGSGSRLRQSLAQLQPLDRRSLWPASSIQRK